MTSLSRNRFSRDRGKWTILQVGLAALAGLIVASSALAQSPRPFQERGAASVTLPSAIVTPKQRTDEIEKWLRDHEQSEGPFLERFNYVRYFWPANLNEFNELAGYSLMVFTFQTHKAEELPLRRVYVRLPDRELPVLKLGSWRMTVDQELRALKKYGPHREDGFYLFPFSSIVRVAQLHADLAANRRAFPILDFPASDAPPWLRGVQNPDPLPNARPSPIAIGRIVKRNTAGYPALDLSPGSPSRQ